MENKRNYHEPCTCNQPGPAPCPIHENKSCRGDKGNCFCLPPKAVPVEVDGCPILFRKVTIPASVGDEETDPPTPGRYRNVLLTYEAGGHAYMYSSDGIPTQLPEKGEKGDKGEQGPQGPAGPAGPQGPQGETGPQGVQGEQGPQGPKGEDGAGIEIAGTVATYADLPTNLTPEDDGKGYYVESEGRLYIWNGTAFPADGDGVHIQGPQGPQGIQGVQGPQGEQGTQGPAGANGADGISPVATVTQTPTGATITITDAQGTTTADIRNGQDGNVPIATTSVAGKVKPDGTTITVTADGTISSAAAYTLPPATTSTLGGVIVGNNLTVDANGTLDATDTTYSAFTGTDGTAAGTAGLVPAPATTDAGKYLKADGTWDTISIPTVTLYSGTGQNTDGAMTQKAVTDTLFESNDTTRIKIGSGVVNGGAASVVIGSQGAQTLTPNSIAIGNGGTTAGSSGGNGYNVAIGSYGVNATGGQSVAIGVYGAMATAEGAITIGTSGAQASDVNSVAIGKAAQASHANSVALGSFSTTGRTYELSLGQNAYGQNPEKTRYIAHVTAGVNDTDAVNKKQLDDAISGVTYSDFTGATSSVAGAHGLVPAPTTSDPDKYLKGDGTWANLPSANNISSTDWNGLWQ